MRDTTFARIKTCKILTFIFLIFSDHISFCQESFNFSKEELLSYQQSLITQEITGSNVAMIYSKGERIYHEVVQSNRQGDKNINQNTIFPIWSMTKPITIVAMMLLHEENRVHWDDPVSNYLPIMKGLKYKDGESIKECKNELKIIHLMTHRSGFKYYNMVSEFPNGGAYGYWTKFKDLQTFVDTVAKYPLEFEPGSRYLYGINQAILGRIVEVISGKNFEEFLNERLFRPLGMTNTSFSLTTESRNNFQPLWINTTDLKGFTYEMDELTYDPQNKAFFGGEGLVSTMEDYAMFCEMLAGNGVFRGKKILSEESIKTMTKAWSSEANDPLHEKLKGYSYGFSVFVLTDPLAENPFAPKGIWGWAGYHNTHFWIDPKNEVFGLFMSRSREFSFEIPLGIRRIVYNGK